MGSYIMNFTVYTMAMCGLICFALFVYKKFTSGSFNSNKSKFLAIEDNLSLAPRKMLYVVRAGEERFLIASDADKTSLISKLEVGERINFEQHLQQNEIRPQNFSQRNHSNNQQNSISRADFQPQNFNEKTSYIGVDELPTIVPKSQKQRSSSNVLKSMVSRVKD